MRDMAKDIKPFVKQVVGMAAKDAHAEMATLLDGVCEDLLPIRPQLAASVQHIRSLLKVGAEKNVDSDGFGLAMSKKLDKLHGRLVEEDGKWAAFKKEMEAEEAKHNKKAVLSAKAKAQASNSSFGRAGFRDRDDRSNQRAANFRGRGRGGGGGQRGSSKSFLDSDSEDDPRNDKMVKLARQVKNDLFEFVPRDQRPREGCFGCGDDHRFSHKCPKFDKVREKVQKAKDRAEK